MLTENNLITLSKEVKLKPYVPRAPKAVSYISDGELLHGAGGTMILDCESYINYFLIAFKDITTSKIIKFKLQGLSWQTTDYFNPQKLSWIMHSYRTVGFNSNKYDLLMIWLAYCNQDTERLQELSKAIIFENSYQSILESQFNFKVHKTNHIDIIEVCPLKGSLKLYGARLHAQRLQDLPFDIASPLVQDQFNIVVDYCINDLDTTEIIFNFLKERLELREAMSIEYQTDLMSKSDAQIAETVISKEVSKINGQWPKRPDIEVGSSFNYNIPSYITYQSPILKDMLEKVRQTKFYVGPYGVTLPKELEMNIPINKGIYRMGIGGLHSCEKNVAYKSDNLCSIRDRDVAAYYPTIIIQQQLYPKHLGMAFLDVYKSIVNARLIAKKNKNFTKDKGLKVTINGTGGKFNDQWSRLRSPSCFIQMVVTGQLSLLMLIEMMEYEGIQVINANTDGIVMLCPQSLETQYQNCIDNWEHITGFKTEETLYSAYYARDVNNYFALKTTGEVKIKGGWAEVGSTTGTPLDNNPSSLICTDAVINLLSKNIPIEQTIMNCKDITRFITVRNVKGGAHKNGYYLGKTIRWYYSTNCQGTINYISNNNKVPDTDNALPCMDLPLEFPADINYNWYIKKTNSILEEIAFKSKANEQLKFF